MQQMKSEPNNIEGKSIPKILNENVVKAFWGLTSYLYETNNVILKVKLECLRIEKIALFHVTII